MPRVLLVRPNDFIVDAMTSLIVRSGHEALRVASSQELEHVSLTGVVGAVVSTAVTSVMPLSFAEAVRALRRRAPGIRLIATTMQRETAKAVAQVNAELGAVDLTLRAMAIEPVTSHQATLGTAGGVLVLRKEDVESRAPGVLDAFVRHLGGNAPHA